MGQIGNGSDLAVRFAEQLFHVGEDIEGLTAPLRSLQLPHGQPQAGQQLKRRIMYFAGNPSPLFGLPFDQGMAEAFTLPPQIVSVLSRHNALRWPRCDRQAQDD